MIPMVCPARERADSVHPPRHHAVKTGSLMAGYHWGMRRITDFGRFAALSLAGQSVGDV
jgi:hypothetical protein